MIPWFRRLLWDESAFTRYTRALLLAAAGAWQSWSIEGEVTSAAIIGACVMGFAGLMGAGDRNEGKP